MSMRIYIFHNTKMLPSSRSRLLKRRDRVGRKVLSGLSENVNGWTEVE